MHTGIFQSLYNYEQKKNQEVHAPPKSGIKGDNSCDNESHVETIL